MSLTTLDDRAKRVVKRYFVTPMRHSRAPFFVVLARVVFTLLQSGSVITSEQVRKRKPFPNVRIKNFGQMTPQLYRGGQPTEDEFEDLATLGIRTVIDLRTRTESYGRECAEALGMRYINLPMSDTEYPKSEDIQQFLAIVGDPTTGKLFVHCAGGRHRTGVLGAVYRFTHDHWTYEQVYEEMKSYDFYTLWLHRAMKKFVQDYWKNLNNGNGPQKSTK
jgi:protein tyrosine/serine phosphatase